MSMQAVAPRAGRGLNPLTPAFVSSSETSASSSEAGSPLRCSSPEAEEGLQRGQAMSGQHLARGNSAEVAADAEASGSGRRSSDVIPAPAPRAMAPRQRNSSSSSLHSLSSSPPNPGMHHPGMMPTYGWGPPFPVYHMYPPPPEVTGPMERAASPPAVFPAGGSPPLPTGFISVPLHGHPMADPGSPTSRHVYAGSPPPYGSSPPPFGSSPPMPYGSSPPGMPGSPPAMMYMPPPPAPLMHAHSGEYGMAHAGYAMQQHQEFVHRMAGMSLSQPPQQAQQQQQQRAGSTGSSGGAGPSSSNGTGRSEGRASARIARSHRAGGAYNPAEFAFDLEEAESGRPDARCTVMIRNIPNKYNQEMMLSVLHKSGFSGTFDFFYLPIDFRNKCNLGYCFINFVSAATAGRLYREYHNKRWEEYNSKKVCEVTYGRVQGRDTLVQHFRASKFPSDDIEFMPLVYTRVEGGVASEPMAIHHYLATCFEAEADGGEADVEAEADADAGEQA